MIPSKLKETFMPNQLCARCDVAKPVIFETFKHKDFSPDQATKLGFCTPKCRDAFCAAIKELSRAI